MLVRRAGLNIGDGVHGSERGGRVGASLFDGLAHPDGDIEAVSNDEGAENKHSNYQANSIPEGGVGGGDHGAGGWCWDWEFSKIVVG